MSWSARQYLAFEAERTRPVRDLLSAVPSPPKPLAVDLGCGPGNSTELLAARFPTIRVHGLDRDADMIAAARVRLPAVTFEQTDVGTWLRNSPPDSVGIILANAVLHWLPEHALLFAALVGKLVVGGSLAVQMPDNLQEPAQVAMREIAAEAHWRAKLAHVDSVRTQVESAAWYYDVLRPCCDRVDVWRTTYHHRLANPAAIVEWFKGSGLRPYLAALDAGERLEYLERYSASIERAYRAAADGSVLLAFPRLFIVAVR